MGRSGKPRASATLAALVVGCLIWVASAAAMPARLQDAEELIEVGAGPPGEPSLLFVGRTLAQPDSIEIYGYLSAVIGLRQDELFIGSPAVETARFTFIADAAIDATENRADVTVTAGSGALRVYRDDAAGASWDEPASFADGEIVSELSLDLRETLQRQAPGVGVVVGDGALVQETAAEFTIGDDAFRFGLAGTEQRLRYAGALSAGAETGPLTTAVVSGSVAVTRRDAMIVQLGGPIPEGTPAAQYAGCPELGPWLAQTEDGIARATELAAALGPGVELDSIDSAAVDGAVQELAALATEQRQIEAPESASEANRLVVTALSTQARGAQAVASALAASDADQFAQGLAVMADGVSLLGRAAAAVAGLAAGCADGA
jgi:hypothetical protein